MSKPHHVGTFLSLSLPCVGTCQSRSMTESKVSVGGHDQRAGKHLGLSLQSATCSLARRVYWHSLPHSSHTSEQTMGFCRMWLCQTYSPRPRSPAWGSQVEEAGQACGWILNAHRFWQQGGQQEKKPHPDSWKPSVA